MGSDMLGRIGGGGGGGAQPPATNGCNGGLHRDCANGSVAPCMGTSAAQPPRAWRDALNSTPVSLLCCRKSPASAFKCLFSALRHSSASGLDARRCVELEKSPSLGC